MTFEKEEIFDSLPEFYRKFLPSHFAEKVPTEVHATCLSCPMTRNHVFHVDTKCCSYQPTIPNYLVGGLLKDERADLAEGQHRMLARIESRMGITPGAVRPPPLKDALYKMTKFGSVGQLPSLKCNFFESKEGKCTIWKHRNAVCSTFFCKHATGQDGRNFWMSVKDYLQLAERQLTRYAIFEQSPRFFYEWENNPDLASKELTPEDVENLPPKPDVYSRMWGEFEGKEEEFYRNCFDIVNGLTRDAFLKIVGFDGNLELFQVGKMFHRSVSETLPETLQLADDLDYVPLENGMTMVASYSPFDPLVLVPELQEILQTFDGRSSLAKTRESILEQTGLTLEDDLILRLYHHRVLVP